MWYKDAEEFKAVNGYEVNGVWYPRVTKILDVKAKPALENFFKEMGHYDSAEEVKNKSAAEGSLVHEAVQKLLVGEAVEVNESIRPAVEAFEIFNQERQIAFHPDYVERRIWSGRHRYAGTVDALASVDGKFGVLDIKTSTGFYPEYNLQTAAYISALQEFEIKQALTLPQEIETRWILRIDQKRYCARCGATLREKGGRSKIRPARPKPGEGGNARFNGVPACLGEEHEWGDTKGEAELREFPYFYKDLKAFMAAKILWEWEHEYWLKQIGYL